MMRILTVCATVWTLATLLACSSPPPPEECDLLIRGGTVIDGTGASGRVADVLVVGDRIVHVGPVAAGSVRARRILDARGLVVTPGFIDAHSHGDPRRTPGFDNFVAMGVTTICLGQDGASPGGRDLATWLGAVEKGRVGLNIAAFIGHGTVRRIAGVGMSPQPTPAQLARMEEIVRAAMDAGAFGLTTGLEYEPGRFAGAVELARVAKPVGECGGLVMSHMRSEDDDAIEGALRELLAQCRAAGCAAHVSHMKIVYAHGIKRADEVLAVMEAARSAGLRVTADVYPYLASYTGIGIVFPDWARPPNVFAKVVQERRDELAAYLRRRVNLRNGPAATVFGTGQWRGRSLAEIAQELGKPFEQVLIDDVGPQGTSAMYFVMAPEVMHRLLADPHVVISSDGSPTMRHPRGHGAFARVIREFVVDRALLTLELAVHKMTGLTAETIGLRDRGVIAKGNAADLLVFDPAKIRDRATYTAPFVPAEGFGYVIVNGVFVRDGGEFTKARPGRLLRRPIH